MRSASQSLGRCQSGIRRALGRESLLRFAEVYFPERFHLAWSDMHHQMSEILESIVGDGTEGPTEGFLRLLVASPRGYGKTSLLAFAYPLWQMAYGRVGQILWVSHTVGRAHGLLKDVTREINENRRLRVDFPHLVQGKRAKSHCSGGAPTIDGIVVGQSFRLLVRSQSDLFTDVFWPRDKRGLVLVFGYHARSTGSRGDLEHYIAYLESLPNSIDVVIGGSHNSNNGMSEHVQHLHEFGMSDWQVKVYKAIEVISSDMRHWNGWREYCRTRNHTLGSSAYTSGKEYWMMYRDDLERNVKPLWSAKEPLVDLLESWLKHGSDWFDRNKQGLMGHFIRL